MTDTNQIPDKEKEKKLFTLKDMVDAMFEGELIGDEASVTRRMQMRKSYFVRKFNVKLPPLTELIKQKS